jgi:hypothetical protein
MVKQENTAQEENLKQSKQRENPETDQQIKNPRKP